MKTKLRELFGINKDLLISWHMMDSLDFSKWYSLDPENEENDANRFKKIITTMRSQMILVMELSAGFEVVKHYHDFKEIYNVLKGEVKINGCKLQEGEHFTVFPNVKHELQSGKNGAILVAELVKIN